jgi:hypothetical protein
MRRCGVGGLSWGFKLRGRTKGGHGWTRARRVIAEEIKPGDHIVVSLRGHRIGRIGEVTKLAVEDKDWDPLVPRSKDNSVGEMGRRIFVRWELETGPDDRKLVVALPKDIGERAQTISFGAFTHRQSHALRHHDFRPCLLEFRPKTGCKLGSYHRTAQRPERPETRSEAQPRSNRKAEIS